MADQSEKSIGDDATYAGSAKRPASSRDVSIGDERTLTGDLAIEETLLDDIEIVDLEARYTVEGGLGEGGMGAVVLATDTRLGRKVAIKRILGEAARSKAAVARFLTEARAIAAISHPNVVQIYELGVAKSGPFLVIEYIDGGSLLDRCKAGPIPPEEAVSVVCQVCDGLAKAHDAGIIHRDIKPANILLTKDGIAKLTDFGLAKAEAADHQMTMTGAVMGTPDFMPPEQRRDAALVDHRSDLWSLAATLYQMVSGRSPKVIRLHELPQELQPILAKALEDEKDARYQSAKEFRDALKSPRSGGSSSTTHAGIEGVLQEGQCKACGTVTSDLTKKFCRNPQCGASLRMHCLKCNAQIPVWDGVCGECGGNQESLLADKIAQIELQRDFAEGLLDACDFEQARRQLEKPVSDDARLASHESWRTDFQQRLESAEKAATQRAQERFVEALKHERDHDYSAAIQALEQVPDALRGLACEDEFTTETPASLLARVVEKRQKSVALDATIRERIAQRQLADLLPLVEQLQKLRPDRQDLQKLRSQLMERTEKQAAQRVQLLAKAEAMVANHQYEAAVRLLERAGDLVVHDGVLQALLVSSRRTLETSNALANEIKEKLAAKQLVGLLSVVDSYLALHPADTEHLRLRDTLAERDRKIAADITAALQKATAMRSACEFHEAFMLLQRVPAVLRSEECNAVLSSCEQLAAGQQAVQSAIAAGNTNTAEEPFQAYRQLLDSLDITDESLASYLTQAARIRRRRRNVLVAVLLFGLSAVAIAAGTARYAARQQQALIVAELRARQNNDRMDLWQQVIDLDPKSSSAHLGRARGRLKATPPDTAGAINDVNTAGGLGARDDKELRMTRAAALAIRAAQGALDGRSDEAEKDLQEANSILVGLSGSSPIAGDDDAVRSLLKQTGLDAASTLRGLDTLASAWVGRAEKACEKQDATALGYACQRARVAGAAASTIQQLWIKLLTAIAMKGDAQPLSLAVAKSNRFAIPVDVIATAWIQCGEEAAAKDDLDNVTVSREAAEKLGPVATGLSRLKAREFVLLARKAIDGNDKDSGVRFALQAMEADAEVTRKVFAQRMQQLRDALIEECRSRVASGKSNPEIGQCASLLAGLESDNKPALPSTGAVITADGISEPLPRMPGLVAFYPCDGDAKDVSGNKHDGTVMAASLSADRFGVKNRAYAFDGKGSAIVFGGWFVPTSFTISMWVKAERQSGHAILVDNNHGHGFNWVCQALDGFEKNIYSWGEGGEFVLPTSEWAHLTLCSDGAEKLVYINGKRAARGRHSVILQKPTNLTLGAWVGERARYWAGSMDDVMVFDRAIGEEEVRTLFEASRRSSTFGERHKESVDSAGMTSSGMAVKKPTEQIFVYGFKHVYESHADKYLADSTGMRKYSYEQSPPMTYWGPAGNNSEGQLVYRFPFESRAQSIKLLVSSATWDFTKTPGGLGRGASSLDVSSDGKTWITLRENLKPRKWGVSWTFDDLLPADVLGGTELWIRMRFYVEKTPIPNYTTSQFGRSTAAASENVFEVKATLGGNATSASGEQQ